MVMSHLNNLYTIQEDNEYDIFDAEHNLKSSYYECDYDYNYECECVYKYKRTKNEEPVEKLALVKPAWTEGAKHKDKKLMLNRLLYFTITICFSSYVLFCHNINT